MTKRPFYEHFRGYVYSKILVCTLLGGPVVASPIAHPLKTFGYADVQVTGGPMGAQAQAARDFFLALNEDSLLHGFRLRAGQPAPGMPMGGWYDPDGFAAAHPFGQYLSALAKMYASTGDHRFKAKVARLIHGFHQTMAPDGYFYASAKVAREWPCYVYDKNAAGMRDAFTLTGNREALVVLSRMTDWAQGSLPRRSDEWYTLAEGLYQSYALTKETRYLRLASEFDYAHDFFNLFADGINAFTSERQAYSHVNSLSSAAQTFESTGQPHYLRAIENAWTFLTQTQMYASGGWGPDERFVAPGQGKLAASLETSTKNFETPCGTYANVKLDRYLIRLTGQSKYGDNMERVLLNGMLAILPNQPDGRTFYYSNYHPGAQKAYFDFVWPCCSGTYAQVTAEYPLDLYFHDDRSIFVNLFAPSAVTWKSRFGTIGLEQQTRYPLSETTSITLHLQHPVLFSVQVRIPSWLQKDAVIQVNGRDLDLRAVPGRFLAIHRKWRNGDVLELKFSESLRFEPVDAQTPDRAALMNGPLLLAALSNQDVILHGDQQTPQAWILPVTGSATDFVARDGTAFRPLYLIQEEPYTIYPRIRPSEPESAVATSLIGAPRAN